MRQSILKRWVPIAVTAAFATVSAAAFAQATMTDAEKKAKAFKDKEAAMQKASKSSASGSMPVDKNAPASGKAPTGPAQGQAMQDASKSSASGSKPVDPNAKAASPMKAPKDMTPEERKKLQDAAQKASKP